MNRPTVEVAGIFRSHGDAFIDRHSLGIQQLKAIQAIRGCRTAALGGHVDGCPLCGGDPLISYNRCRNRHCNKCQSQARDRWIEARKQELLDTRYFHVVFTLPHDLHGLVLQNQAELYAFHSAPSRKRFGKWPEIVLSSFLVPPSNSS
jgi:hypothetical protein